MVELNKYNGKYGGYHDHWKHCGVDERGVACYGAFVCHCIATFRPVKKVA